MQFSCIVKGCSSVQSPNDPELVFYRLPWNNIQLRTQWVKMAGYNPFDANDVKHITKDHRICSLHFDSNNLDCSKQMVPTLNLPKATDQKLEKSVSCNQTVNNISSQKEQKPESSQPVLEPVKREHPPPPPPPPQQSTLIENDNPVPEKKAKNELNSDSSIIEDKSSIDENSEPINSTQAKESPSRSVSIQASLSPLSSSDSPHKEKRILVVSHHQHSVMIRMSSLWKAGKLCDAIISNGSADVKIHKIVLSAVCSKMMGIFDDAGPNKFSRVTFPKSISKEALIAFAEFIYNGLLDLDTEILGQLKTIGKWLEMKDFEQLCDDQLKTADSNNSQFELLQTDVKQEFCSDNPEDLNADFCDAKKNDFANNSTIFKTQREIESNKMKLKEENPEEQKYVNKTFHCVTTNNSFLSNISSQDKNSSLAPTVQPSVSSLYLPSLSVISRRSTALWPASLNKSVYNPIIRPVGYITPKSEQKTITKEMIYMVGTHNSLTLNDNIKPLEKEIPVKKENNT